ncbi:MAG: SDR family oxidoreductase [Chloroflexota bacterium]
MNQKPLNILVTGTSSGFGKLIAQTLAADGHHVFATMRGVEGKNREAAAALRAWAREGGFRLNVFELDVTDQNSVDAAVSAALSHVGHLDVLVNNAGVGNVGILEGFTMEQVQSLFEVNAFGPLRVAKAVLPSMRARRSGLLIHVSSATGRIVIPFVSPYSASKFALEALAESLSFQLAPFGVESVLVEPGSFGTEAFGKLVTPADAEVLAGYGEMATMPQQQFAAMGEMLQGEDAPDPQAIADAVKQLVDMPPGKRPLRTVVGPLTVDGVEELNQAYEASKQMMLQGMGM